LRTSDKGNYINNWKKEDGEWKINSKMWNSNISDIANDLVLKTINNSTDITDPVLGPNFNVKVDTYPEMLNTSNISMEESTTGIYERNRPTNNEFEVITCLA
jgi:hypothetical protein